MRFFLISRGSLEELVDDLNVCLNESYLPGKEVTELKEQARGVLILINGYLHHLRSRCATVREGDEADSELMVALDDLLFL